MPPLIASLESTLHYLYIVTTTYVIQRDVESMREIQRWDLPSPPCSALLLSSRSEDHWSIVCTHHLRTHDMTMAHGFDFAERDDVRAPITFLSMREIGVRRVPDEAAECRGIRLVHYDPSTPNPDVCQQGTDVAIRKHNSLMERIASATLLHRDTRRGLLIRHDDGLYLYDCTGRNRRFVTAPLSPPVASPVCYAIVGPIGWPIVVVANVAAAGKLSVLDRWWWWVYVRWAFWACIVLAFLLPFSS